jgi:ribonuclease HI
LVQIHLNECNPDSDINTTEPTIQIIHDKALIFTNKGNHLITIPKNRLEWLWNQYNTHSNEHHQLDPPCQPFETEVIWLYERYKYRIPKTDPLKRAHYTLPAEILDQIITLFNIKTSYFSSPVTCSTLVNTYYSPFQRDSIFGSRGTVFKHKWLNKGYAHPHNKEDLQKAIHWARLAAKENQDTITILTIPDAEWTTSDTPYKTIFDDTHVIIHFPPDTITYTEPTIPPKLNKEPRIEPLAVRILCIHHKFTTIEIPNLEAKLLQITTKLRINPPHIIAPPPTPINTKVHKYLKWTNSSNPPQINLPNSLQLPEFPTIYQPKYPQQYCYYTDGSLTPPKQQANGFWDPAQTGYGIWNPLLKINLPQRLIGLQNILRAEISAIHHTLQILIQEFPNEPTHIFTDSLNSLYLINTQLKHPTLQNNHPDKTILTSIVSMLKNRTATTYLYKVRAHTNIIGNDEADKLAKERSKIILVSDIPYHPHENAHSTPYWWSREDDHPFRGPIRHLKSYLEKLEKEENEKISKNFDNINKWVNNPLINNKISNNFWINPTVTDSQITQLLKFRYGQYMGNARKHLFWNEL